MSSPSPAQEGTGHAPSGGLARIGRYEVLRRVGVGGMAEVFRARAHGPSGYCRELIIKTILPHLVEDAALVRAFVDEAKILGLLSHPNVVGVYDFGEDQGRHYLALEYLDGPSMAHLLDKASAASTLLPVGLVAFVGREICRGLSAVHGLCDPLGRPLQIVHRDVTPSNVMTTHQGAVKLLDFGIAKMADAANQTVHGHIKGKAGYLAPEQIKGDPIDGRVDLFAVGVVLHEALSGEHLFYGEGGPMAAIYRTVEMPLVPPGHRRKEVPAALDDIVMRALARNPADRYQTAAEMADDLDAIVADAGFTSARLADYLAGLGSRPA